MPPDNIHKIIKTLVIKGQISESRIDKSFRRVIKMKGKWP